MLHKLIRFLIPFLVILGVTYLIHKTILDRFFNPVELINLSYGFNAIFTLVFTGVLIFLSKKNKDQLGFIFLIGSFVKIGLFLFIFTLYNINIQKSTFIDFFIPYAICLILEVYYVSKVLNS